MENRFCNPRSIPPIEIRHFQSRNILFSFRFGLFIKLVLVSIFRV